MTSQGTTATTPPSPQTSSTSTLKTVLLVIGSIVLAIILIGTAIRFVYSLGNDDTSGTYTVQRSFDQIELHSTAAEVEVEFADVDRAEIRFEQGDSDLRLRHDVSGGVLSIRVDRPGWGWIGFGFGDWGWHKNARLALTLPEGMERDAVDLTIDTTAGDVRVFGEFGDVDVESTAGNLRLAGAADDVTVSTTAGDVLLDGLEVSGSFRSESTAGNGTFDLATLPRSMDVSSTAGDIRVTIPRGDYRIETSTTAGEVSQHVSSNQDAQRVYRFETTAGDIELGER